MTTAKKPRRSGPRRLLSRRFLALLPVLLGLALLVFLVRTRTGSPRQPAAEAAQAVRVLSAPEADVVPRTLGYGRVRPSLTWEGSSEVAGRILETHDLCAPGAMVPEGTELFRIDPVDYELAVEEISRTLAELEIQVIEIGVQRAADEALLEIEERSLGLVEEDLERQRELRGEAVVSQSVLDEAERKVLAQKAVVQRLRNSLALLPTRKRALEARTASLQAKLDAARRNLARTRIVAPFDLRIRAVLAQEGTFAARGAPLLRADATSRVEVAAQFQIDRVRRLLPAGRRLPLSADLGASGLRDLLRLEAVVRIREADFVVEWEARFDRIEASFDPRTHTVGFIVVVEDPYGKARTGTRPVLARDMFVEVELRSAEVAPGVVLPRSALDGEHVWIADAENRMRRRAVRIRFAQGDFVVLDGGVEAGERVVVSDPVPALDGVLVDPREDDGLRRRIVAYAEGREAGR